MIQYGRVNGYVQAVCAVRSGQDDSGQAADDGTTREDERMSAARVWLCTACVVVDRRIQSLWRQQTPHPHTQP